MYVDLSRWQHCSDIDCVELTSQYRALYRSRGRSSVSHYMPCIDTPTHHRPLSPCTLCSVSPRDGQRDRRLGISRRYERGIISSPSLSAHSESQSSSGHASEVADGGIVEDDGQQIRCCKRACGVPEGFNVTQGASVLQVPC